MTPTDTLSRGIAAAEAGDRVEARALLTEVVQTDDSQLEGWWWLSQVIDSLEERAICLENVLTLDPAHKAAQHELAWVQEQQEKFFRPVYAPGQEKPIEGVTPLSATATAPITTDYPNKDEFDNEWLCPYCAAATRPKDAACPHCKQPLVITRRVSRERSAWLWRGIFVQIGFILTAFAALSVSYALIFRYYRLASPLAYVPLYFGQPVDRPAELAQKALEIYPLWVFWAFLAAGGLSLLLIGLLYFRVKQGNTVYFINATAMLALGLGLAAFSGGSTLQLVLGSIVLIFGATQMLVTLNLWNDFKFKSERLRLVTDGGIKNHASFYLAGRKYAELGMWGLAMLHYRRAVARKERNAVYHLALALAYSKINRPDLAEKSLDAAERIDPDSPEIWELRKQVSAQKARPRRPLKRMNPR